MKLAKLLLLTFLSFPALATNYQAQSIATGKCSPHDTFGHPSSGDILLCRDAFEVGYDSSDMIPAWTVYRITQSSVDKHCSSQPGFRADPYISKNIQATNADYKHNVWDKGHMTPRATADISCKAETQSVYYTNAAPQHEKLNRRGWRVLEEEVRDLADQMGEKPIYVVTGAIFSGMNKMNDRVTIPEDFYKALYIPSLGQSIVFVFQNAALGTSKSDLAKGVMSLASFEEEYGIHPFNIPSSQKAKVGTIFSQMYQ